MNAPFIDPTRRVILPQSGEGCRGLLIPQAVVITQGTRQLMTPTQYKNLGGRVDAQCPCGTPVNFTRAHRVDGTFDVPDHFKTKSGHEHAPECGYHFRKAARDLARDEHEYDLTKPYRIHLNFMDDEIRNASLARGAGMFYGRDNNGLPINETYKDWQPVSINTVEKLASFVSGANPERLKNSVVILNQQAVPWAEFCLSDNTPHRWAHLFNALSEGHHHLKLFMLQKKKPEQIDMFRKQSDYVPRDQVVFEKKDRTIILRPCLRASSETLEICTQVGIVLALSIPERLQRSIIDTKSGVLRADIPISARSQSLVGHLPVYPQYAGRKPVP